MLLPLSKGNFYCSVVTCSVPTNPIFVSESAIDLLDQWQNFLAIRSI